MSMGFNDKAKARELRENELTQAISKNNQDTVAKEIKGLLEEHASIHREGISFLAQHDPNRTLDILRPYAEYEAYQAPIRSIHNDPTFINDVADIIEKVVLENPDVKDATLAQALRGRPEANATIWTRNALSREPGTADLE